MKQQRIIIDTDPGIDDAIAILLALASPELRIEALTIVSGNCTTEQGVKNALGILELGGYPQIPVYKGTDIPLIQPLLIASDTHGSSGLGYAHLSTPQYSPQNMHAVEFLIEHTLAYPDEITIVAIGPLTNLALAVRIEPRFATAVKELIVMGGAINHGGNVTPLAEFNIFCDPHAAHIIFHAGIPTTLVPLDVTYQTLLTRKHVERLLETSSPIASFIEQSTRFYMEYHTEVQSIQGCVINDPLALALTFAPDLVETRDLFVDVDISGGVSMGKTYADLFGLWRRPPNMKVALDVKQIEYIELVVNRLMVLAEQIEGTKGN